MTAHRRAAAVSVVVAFLAAGAAVAPAGAASAHRCHLPEFASGELVVKGITCTAAARIVHRALRAPGCTPTTAQAAHGEGCRGTTKVRPWTCTGLFPGEGYDLRCHAGSRRIHAGAGG
jgi:hypothetical protein